MNEALKKKLKNLPNTPGVYIMRNDKGEVIYVGKALVLKNRVRSYFSKEAQKYVKVAAMVSHIADFEYIITDTELEALVLESNLIKKYRPYYNIMLKDDKHFPYVRVDLKEEFPRVTVVRSVKDDGAKYFGPFIAAHVIQDVLDDIYRLYPLRSCKKEIAAAIRRRERPCLNYEMGRCVGPCTGKVSQEEYMALVNEVVAVISGDKSSIRKELTRKMEEAAEQLNFEAAAALRDKIKLVDRIRERQKAGFPNLNDKDVFGLEVGATVAVVQAFLFRDGKLNYAQKYYIDLQEGEIPEQAEAEETENGTRREAIPGESAEIMGTFLQQYYTDKSGIPKQIYVLPRPAGAQLLMDWLSGKKGSKVKIIQPARGDNRKLAVLAQKNARDAIKLREGAQKQRDKAAGDLAKALGMERTLARIECYDISNTQGTDNVASMVVFTGGKPNKKQYRRFKIKTFEGANDFAAMNEVLTRRLLRGLQEDAGFTPLPDLVIIDGGKGQLSSALDAAASVGLDDLPIVSLAKQEEEIFVPGLEESVRLKPGSPAFRLVTGIRDEAHRFAIEYHRKLREKRHHKSVLDDIEGVGNSRKRTLLRHFGSLKKLKEADLDEIKAVQGIPQKVAQSIYGALHGKETGKKDEKNA